MRALISFSILILSLISTANAEARLFNGRGLFPRMRERIQERRIARTTPMNIPSSQTHAVPEPVRTQFPAANDAFAAAPAARPERAEEINPVEPKNFQGVPIPKKDAEPPRLADSIFVGKSCRTRDKTVREPENLQTDKAEYFYHLHPNLKASVKPKGGKGVEVEIQQGPYTVVFSSDKSSESNRWIGEAQIKLDLSGARFPPGAEKPKTDYKGNFSMGISKGSDGKQIQTLTFLRDKKENTTVFVPPADIMEGVTEEYYTKVSTDGNFIKFSLVKDKGGKIVAYQVTDLCGDDFTGQGELNVGDDTHKITPATAKVFAELVK